MSLALRITETEEAHADAALLALSRWRDSVRYRGDHHTADLIEGAMEIVQAVCRENRK